jgi:hypothetical protein
VTAGARSESCPGWCARRSARKVTECELAAKPRCLKIACRNGRNSVHLYEASILPQARLAQEAALSTCKVGRVDPLMLFDSQMTLFNYEISRVKELVNFNKTLAEIDLLTGKRVF